MSLVIGVDPGTHTGVAVWDAGAKKFLTVEALPVHRALELVRPYTLQGVPVLFEDARKRQWFGHTGREVLQGAGAAKRDATIWQHFLEDMGSPFLARAPRPGSTKWPADQFKRLTGWTAKTNEHARDAGVLVFGFNDQEIGSVVRSWEQSRANTATRTPARG